MRYYICDRDNKNFKFNAGSKAVRDANQILEQCGYKPAILGYRGRKSKIKQYFLLIYRLFVLLFLLKKGDIIFIQYPLPLNDKVRNIFYKLLLKKNVVIQILIHDLPSFRFRQQDFEDSIITDADVIICHTEAMKKFLVNIGVNSNKIKILYLFDYITESSNKNQISFGNKICFAGNLEKSEFIPQLVNVKELQFCLYGLPSLSYTADSHIQYMGKFHPDNIECLVGDWGLVWDGDSIDTCSGNLGEYLRINSSHKLSLYLAAGIPVIIWEESSLKAFIETNNLGIAVKSLNDIAYCIKQLSMLDKQMIKKSVQEFSIKLRNGEMLKDVLYHLNF